MKVLESAPHRYDKGMMILTLGKINKYYDRIIENIQSDMDTTLCSAMDSAAQSPARNPHLDSWDSRRAQL